MTGTDPTPTDRTAILGSDIPEEHDAERTRGPLEVLAEFQETCIEMRRVYETLEHGTSIPDLEAMAGQSTAKLAGLFAARQEQPIAGGNRQFGVVELGPLDIELDGLKDVQDFLHELFKGMYRHEALMRYQTTVPYDRDIETLDNYIAAQRAYAREVADRRCAEICPSAEEVEAISEGEHWYNRWVDEHRPNRKNPLPF